MAINIQDKIKRKKWKLLIGGKWVNAVSGKTFVTLNPATEEPLANVAEGEKADINLAVKAARKPAPGPAPGCVPGPGRPAGGRDASGRRAPRGYLTRRTMNRAISASLVARRSNRAIDAIASFAARSARFREAAAPSSAG